MTRVTEILSLATGGRAGNNIVDVIQKSQIPTNGDQLSAFVERNRSLIKEFILVVCGFIIFVMIILFFVLMVTILLNQEKINVQKEEYKRILLSNLDIRNRNNENIV